MNKRKKDSEEGNTIPHALLMHALNHAHSKTGYTLIEKHKHSEQHTHTVIQDTRINQLSFRHPLTLMLTQVRHID